MAGVQDVRDFNSPKIMLGGRERIVQFDLNSFAELEKRYGTVEAAMQGLQKGKMKDIRIILWAGLIHEEAVIDEETGEPSSYNITPYQVGGWIRTPKQMQELSEVLAKALAGDLPAPENIVGKNQKSAQNVAELPPGTATVVMTEEEKAKAAALAAEEEKTKNS